MFLILSEVSKDSGDHERLRDYWCQNSNQLASKENVYIHTNVYMCIM